MSTTEDMNISCTWNREINVNTSCSIISLELVGTFCDSEASHDGERLEHAQI